MITFKQTKQRNKSLAPERRLLYTRKGKPGSQCAFFYFVYISDGCFSSEANAFVLLCGWFFLNSFAMVPHRE